MFYFQVINLNSMRHVTDIPDWCDYQAFGKLQQFDFGAVTSDEELQKLMKMSPIAYVEKGLIFQI